MLRHIPFYATLLNRKLTSGLVARHSHVLVYGAIEMHSMGEKGCIASNKTIASETGLAIQTVANAISHLNNSGWIEVHLDESNHRLGINANMTLTLESKAPYPQREGPLTPPSNIEDSKEDTVRIGSRTTLDLFDQLKEILKEPNARYLDPRKDKLKARLKTYTEEEIIQAARNLTNSTFHMGKNDDNKKYATIDFLIRNDVQVDRWLNVGIKTEPELINISDPKDNLPVDLSRFEGQT